MPLRYVCGIIKDQFGRYLVLDYNSGPVLSNCNRIKRCTLSVESWVGENEDSLDVVIQEIHETLHIPKLSILSSLDLCGTKSLKKPGAYCDQDITVYTFAISSMFISRCGEGIHQRFMTTDQIMKALTQKNLVPTTYCEFVITRMHLWELAKQK